MKFRVIISCEKGNLVEVPVLDIQDVSLCRNHNYLIRLIAEQAGKNVEEYRGYRVESVKPEPD
jgi:hypothetical protein